MTQHLILNLQAHLMSFGGDTIDARGVTRPFPSASMLTGLLANALGYRRTQGELLQRLQDRLVFAARIDRESPDQLPITDFQTADINFDDAGWTTWGRPQSRDGDRKTYDGPRHIMHREYHPDARVTVALRLNNPSESPTLEELAQALLKPARPLFIGRKSCLPSGQIHAGTADAGSAMDALLQWPMAPEPSSRSRSVRILWPHDDPPSQPGRLTNIREYQLTDQRQDRYSIHAGHRRVCEGTANRDSFPQT